MKLLLINILFFLFIQTGIAQEEQSQYILYGIENFEEVKNRLNLKPTQIDSVKNIIKKRDSRFYNEFLSLASYDQLESEEERKYYKRALIEKRIKLFEEAAKQLMEVLDNDQLTAYAEMMQESIVFLRNKNFDKKGSLKQLD